ncbi:MAG: hypothetical protein H6752_10530 [Candidatus Omnitrophica bacterium]|nr:hypothetical protein [Candidatus Omnitrophota bacterium]
MRVFNIHINLKTWALVLGFLLGTLSPSEALDLASAKIVLNENSGVPAKAAEMLEEEIEKRTGIALPIVPLSDSQEGPAICLIRVDQAPEGVDTTGVPEAPEGYSIRVNGDQVQLLGRDDRGVLFAAGRLLRLLSMSEGEVELSSDVDISTAPKYPIRGHQLGYRNTANTYDAWDLETFEQYIRDLIAFGANSVELITALDPEEKDGPVMTETQWDMNLKLAELAHSYGLDVWFWMPLSGDVTDPEESKKELEERDRFFKACPAIDHIMVPGGDPGRTTPAVLMPWLEKMAEVLHKHFPEAGLWVSNQKFKPDENDVFFDYLQEHRPTWLRGVAYGPGTLITLEETRRRTPDQFPLRRYPDITHCVRCQYPVPKWDGVFAQTLDREPPNPRPRDTAHIHNVWADLSDGFVSYSDGAHDDFNKMVWSALAWDPEADVNEIVEDYCRLFFGPSTLAETSQGIWGLEKNWDAPISENRHIAETLNLWRLAEKRGGEALKENWRFQMYLFRAVFDAYIQIRHEKEMEYQRQAYSELAKASEIGCSQAIAAAREALAQADRIRIRPDLRLRLEQLGVDLQASIGYQMSVREPYRARNPERGALLDKADRPLNDRPWLENRFDQILALEKEGERLAAIDQILNWDDPGPGGFYDDLGNATLQPHLVRQTTWEEDPMFITGPQEAHYRSLNNETLEIDPLKFSWLDQAQTLYGVPLKVAYKDLDPSAEYRVRVTYFGRYHSPMRLVADGDIEIHGPMTDSDPVWPVEFDIPKKATEDGKLELSWELVEGRGCQVAEVWLMKK